MRAELILESLVDGVGVLDANGAIVQANKSFAGMHGYKSPKELIGKLFFTLFADRELPRVRKRFMEAMKRKEPVIKNFEATQGRKDGGEFPVEVDIRFLWDEKGALAGSIAVVRDITERKRMYSTLRESEERYRRLLESITDGVSVLDYDYRHILVNDATARMCQMLKEDLVGKKETDLFPGFEETVFFKAHKQVMETREPVVVSDEFIFEDGRKGWYEINVYPVPEGILVISRDVTERKRMEEELRASEETYRKIFEGVNEGLFATDLEGCFVSINPAGARMLGFVSPKEILDGGISLIDLYANPDDWKEMTGKLREEGPVNNVIARFKRKNGSVWLEISYNVVREDGGSIISYDGVFEDVTRRVEMEKHMRVLAYKLDGLSPGGCF